jgi:predicted nucleic acid-binding protein
MLGIPGVAAMELVVGCRNQTELQRVQKFLGRFDVVWPEAPEFARAYDLLAAHRLTSGLSIPDCLIAAMVLARRTRLYTFNAKHFKSVPGLDAREPYSRA